MVRTIRTAVLGAAGALSIVVCAPAVASATKLFVGSRVASPGNSCKNPGFTSIQSALDAAAPESTIEICGGAYKEQLQIEKAVTLTGVASPTVSLPATPAGSESACDLALNGALGGEDEDLVSICTAGTVTISSVIFEAKWPEGTCDDSLYGILVAGGATLDTTKVKVDGAGAFPINGCQGGVGIEIGSQGGNQVGHATLSHDTIENYQKNGVTVDGSGSTASVTSTTITGAGPAEQGQNGIQISRGATANINKVKVSDDECDTVGTCGAGSSVEWAEDGAGVLFYLPGSHSVVSSSSLSNNDIGVEYVSGSAQRPETPEITLASDKVNGGYASVQLNQGNAVMSDDRLAGAPIGIDVNSYGYGDDEYAPLVEVVGGKVEGSRAAVQIERDLGELPGRLTLTGTKLHGFVVKEDPQFEVIQ
jgi:hypothetical protein